MTTISAYTQNLSSTASKAPASAAREEGGLPSLTPGFRGAAALDGSTPFSTSNPGFGSRSNSSFSLGSFLG